MAVILAAFDRLDLAERERFGVDTPGFFVRDDVDNANRMGVPDAWTLNSDMGTALKPGSIREDGVMSLDQISSLYVGWWGVTKWSTDAANVNKAKDQIDRVMRYLMDRQFIIRLSNGNLIPDKNGPDCRYASGFLCEIASRATGKPYLGTAKVSLTIKGDPDRFRDDVLGIFELPGYKIPATYPPATSTLQSCRSALSPSRGSTPPPKVAIRFRESVPGFGRRNHSPMHTFDRPASRRRYDQGPLRPLHGAAPGR